MYLVIALSCLFIENSVEINKVYRKMINSRAESSLQALLATHLFSHLVPLPEKEDRYFINDLRFPTTLCKCPCGCGERLYLGNTGFGMYMYNMCCNMKTLKYQVAICIIFYSAM